MFYLLSDLDCEIFREDVWAPTSFGHSKFEVRNFLEFFHLWSALDSEFLTGGRLGTNFFLVMLNFRLKFFQNFLFHTVLWMPNFSKGVLGQLFLVMPNLRPKNFLEFFHLQSALDSEFFRGVLWAPVFFGHAKFEFKNFSEFFHYRVLCTLNFSE